MKRLIALVLAAVLLAGCSPGTLAIDALDKDRDFGAFHASAPSVEEANQAYALVQDALGCYPEGFAAYHTARMGMGNAISEVGRSRAFFVT